ncbi:MAG: Fe-S cluster assembly protein SufB [Candidatus Nanoarchaeia archaeon]|nr:Fe-S cluster assembly protein SufB [Candidatus Nanoarchaeia archaeon]
MIDLKSNKENMFGISSEIVKYISKIKKESQWMLDFRLDALEKYFKMDFPKEIDIKDFDFKEIVTYVKNDFSKILNNEDLPSEIKHIYDKLGLKKAEEESLGATGFQYQSSMIYSKIKDYWAKKGVIFLNSNDALIEYEDLFRNYFSKSIQRDMNKLSLLHYAFWSGGTFIYVPEGVKVKAPLQSYYYMEGENMGQFEHTIIIADKDSEVQFIEGCSAPMYKTSNVHVGVVELFLKENSKLKFSTIQNWSKNVYNLGFKKAIVEKDALIEWVSGSFGSKYSMLYPCVELIGDNSKSDAFFVSVTNKDQFLDSGFKAIHLGKNTSSKVKSKSIVMNGGESIYKGKVYVDEKAINSKDYVDCDSLILDKDSVSKSFPLINSQNSDSIISHEAKIGEIGEEELFYLMSRGIKKERAKEIIINGFIEPIVRELPMEYAVELNRIVAEELDS